jgi:hypothetical protein
VIWFVQRVAQVGVRAYLGGEAARGFVGLWNLSSLRDPGRRRRQPALLKGHSTKKGAAEMIPRRLSLMRRKPRGVRLVAAPRRAATCPSSAGADPYRPVAAWCSWCPWAVPWCDLPYQLSNVQCGGLLVRRGSLHDGGEGKTLSANESRSSTRLIRRTPSGVLSAANSHERLARTRVFARFQKWHLTAANHDWRKKCPEFGMPDKV